MSVGSIDPTVNNVAPPLARTASMQENKKGRGSNPLSLLLFEEEKMDGMLLETRVEDDGAGDVEGGARRCDSR